MMVDLPELVQHCHEIEKKNVNEGGAVTPHYIMQNDKNEVALVDTPWENYRDTDQKRMSVNMARLIALQLCATRLVFVSEAWTSRQKIDQERIEPSQDPNKEEILLILSRDQSGATMYTATIRLVEGRRFVGPLVKMDGLAEDNMSDILPPPDLVREFSENPEKREQLRQLLELMGAKKLEDVRPSDLGIVH